MTDLIRRFKGLLIAVVALSLSASLTFGAQAPAAGYALGGSYEDSNGTPEASGDEDANETPDANETQDPTEATDETTSDSADNCTTDPTTLTAEQLAAMSHGSIVCWAAQQTEWPAWFKNHGQFVACWAHTGKADAPSCTVAPVAGAAPATHGKSNGKGQGRPGN